MGIYIYSVRTKSITVEGIDAPVHSLRYLCKPYLSFVDPHVERLKGAARAVWSRRPDTPAFVFVNHADDDKPCDGAEVYEWDGRAYDYDPEPNMGGCGKRLGYLRKVGDAWTIVPLYFEVSVGRDTGPNSRHVHSHKIAFSRPEAEGIKADAALEGLDAWVATVETVDPELDRLVRENSSFHCFRELLDAKGNYLPSLDVRESYNVVIADAYDVAMTARGDDRRAFRYGRLSERAVQ